MRPERRSLRDYALFAEATAALAAAAAIVALVPFKRIAALASRAPRRGRGAPVDVARLKWAIAASARRVPWRAKCFEQGLAAQHMLRRRGVAATLHYGVAQPPGAGLIAHVWVTAGAIEVVGTENAGDFVEIARFAVMPE